MKTLTHDSERGYRRDLGWKTGPNGKIIQHRFLLGGDHREALIRNANLEKCWETIKQQWEQEDDGQDGMGFPRGPRPLWDNLSTLIIAKAIAAGRPRAQILPPSHVVLLTSAKAAVWLNGMQDLFPMVQLGFIDGDAQQAQKSLNRLLDAKEEAIKSLRRTTVKQTLFGALTAYQQWVKDSHQHNGKLSSSGNTLIERIDRLQKYTTDRPLSQLDLANIEAWVKHWENRPIMKKSGQPAKVETCKDSIKLIRRFIKWLHKSSQFEWRIPQDWIGWDRTNVKPTPAENAARSNAQQVQTYTLEELRVLWDYASSHERFYMILALNCSFGVGEISTLQVGEINGNFIKRIRNKTGVYGEWLLWQETQDAIKWYSAQRPKTDHQYLCIARTGRPINDLSANSNRPMRIQNAWTKLYKRITKDKDHEGFRRLSFNKLRKTSADQIRQIAGHEIASLHLSHGKPTDGDSLLGCYTNPLFMKLFEAHDKLGEMLAPIFAAIPEPFTSKVFRPVISIGTVRKIRRLKENGFKIKKIAEELGVSADTVHYHLRRT